MMVRHVKHQAEILRVSLLNVEMDNKRKHILWVPLIEKKHIATRAVIVSASAPDLSTALRCRALARQCEPAAEESSLTQGTQWFYSMLFSGNRGVSFCVYPFLVVSKVSSKTIILGGPLKTGAPIGSENGVWPQPGSFLHSARATPIYGFSPRLFD